MYAGLLKKKKKKKKNPRPEEKKTARNNVFGLKISACMIPEKIYLSAVREYLYLPTAGILHVKFSKSDLWRMLMVWQHY